MRVGNNVSFMDMDTFRAIFREMPGIKEYGFGEKIHILDPDLMLPSGAWIGNGYDPDRAVLKGTYSIECDMGGTVSKREGEILEIPLPGATEEEKNDAHRRYMSMFQKAIFWMRWELELYGQENEERREWLTGEQVSEHTRIVNELWPTEAMVEEERVFLAENNPFRVGELTAAMRAEIEKPEHGFAYADVLRKFVLTDDVSEEDRFGYGQVLVEPGRKWLSVKLEHEYSLEGATGKNYSRSDKRELFRVDYGYFPESDPRQRLTDIVLLTEELRELLNRAERVLKEGSRNGSTEVG